MKAEKGVQAGNFKSIGLVNLVMVAIAILLFLMSLAIGSVNVPLVEAARVFFHGVLGQSDTSVNSAIILGLRLPRVITAAIVGAALAVSGAATQGLLKNPLADGSILGISAGGSLGAVLCIAFSASVPVLAGFGVTVASIIFAFVSLLAVLAITWRFDRGLDTNTIILVGVVFSMFAGSLTSLIITFSVNKLESIVFWGMGSLSAVTGFGGIAWLAPVCIAGMLFLLARSRELNAFALGEEQAGYLGVNTKAVKLQVMVAVAVLIGSAVSVSGIIGFVGLISPHIMRLFTGPDHRKLIPASALFGASFLMLADLISCKATSPVEIPIGVVTTLAGALLFFVLFNSMRKKVAR